jgi:zinc protease
MKVVSGQQSVVSKFFLLTFVILSFVSAGFAQAGKVNNLDEQAASVKEFDVNGLKVLVKRRVNSPTVAAGLFIRGGARNISATNAGIENLMLETATLGSKNFPREVLRRELSKTGSNLGASVSSDYSVLSMTSTRQSFDRSWEIFTDVILNPTFTTSDLEQSREKIASALRERETNNDNFLNVLQERILYTNHPYSNDVMGTLETISRFSSKDLTAHHRKIMQTSQLLLVIVGDVDAADLQKRIAATLGKLPRGDYKEQPFPAIDFSKPTLDITQRTLPTNYIQGVFNAPSLNSPDYYAMRVAVTILQSLVHNEVRVKRQLSYAPNAELGSMSANTANIYVTAVDANTAVSVMLDQINALKTRTLNDEAISGIAEFYLTNYYLNQETNVAQAAELAKYELVGGGWRNSFEFLNRVREVTSKEVQAVSNKYMKNIRFIVIGNPSAIDKSIFLPSN